MKFYPTQTNIHLQEASICGVYCKQKYYTTNVGTYLIIYETESDVIKISNLKCPLNKTR